jgi:predicted RNA-binding Zn-ribbon protein involved in translation (DUF1610 family)
VVDAEVVDETAPQLCPECGAHDIRREKKLALYAVLTLATFGAGIAVGRIDIATFIALVMLLAFLVTPAYQCRECGKRFE